jgi:hypothetical protein
MTDEIITIGYILLQGRNDNLTNGLHKAAGATNLYNGEVIVFPSIDIAKLYQDRDPLLKNHFRIHEVSIAIGKVIE